MEAFTRANFIAVEKSALGTPYLYGGVDPFNGGADCSGFILWGALQFGVTLPRTTEAEWAGLPHVVDRNLGGIQPGDIVEFEVPSDGGAPPQHVGVYLGAGLMIADPHTGADVSISSIPDESDIWPIGYCQLPFVAEPPSAPPPTPSTPEEEQMIEVVVNGSQTHVFEGITNPGHITHHWQDSAAPAPLTNVWEKETLP